MTDQTVPTLTDREDVTATLEYNGRSVKLRAGASLGPEIVNTLEDAVNEAIEEVKDDRSGDASANISLSFSVGYDKDGDIEVKYVLKSGLGKKGTWHPSVDQRLPFR